MGQMYYFSDIQFPDILNATRQRPDTNVSIQF